MPVRKNPWCVCVCCVILCCQKHVCEIEMVVPSVDASVRDLVSVLFLCVCVGVCVCVVCEGNVHACKKKTMALYVCLFSLCVLVNMFVSLYGGAKCGCLCHRPSVIAACECVCMFLWHSVDACKKKTPGCVFVCCVILCCRGHVCELERVVPRMEDLMVALCDCYVSVCVCVFCV